MLRFLTDEDLDGRLTRALLVRVPGLDLVRVQDTGLMQIADPEILEWAATEARIVLTHDRTSMTAFAAARINSGKPMPGLFVVDRHAALGRTLSDLELMVAASAMDEWQNQIVFLPL